MVRAGRFTPAPPGISEQNVLGPRGRYARSAGTSPWLTYAQLMEQVLITTVLTMLVMVSVTVAAIAIVVRRIRRGYRSWRARICRPAALTGSGDSNVAALPSLAASTLGSPSWWALQRDRQRMWRAVTSAQRAVGAAGRAGAPVGDLPAVTRQLVSAARTVDAALRASAGARGPVSQVATERRRIESAAQAIQVAALESLETLAGVDVGTLVSTVHHEVVAVAAGVRAARIAARLP